MKKLTAPQVRTLLEWLDEWEAFCEREHNMRPTGSQGYRYWRKRWELCRKLREHLTGDPNRYGAVERPPRPGE